MLICEYIEDIYKDFMIVHMTYVYHNENLCPTINEKLFVSRHD